MGKLNKVIALIGPTGSGKTELSLEIAAQYKASIINLDSVQMYQELNIGSAKPTHQELERVLHHLVNITTIAEPYNSFDIFQRSYNLICELFPKQNVILTGGTGLYYKTLLWGMFSLQTKDLEYRRSLETWTSQDLYHKLLDTDSKAAVQIHPNDRIRIIRALEVVHSSGKSIVTLRENDSYTPPAPFLFIGISYPRPILYERINQRVENMFEQGLLKEMSDLLNLGYENNSILHKTIGYKELFSYFNGQSSLDDCIKEIQKHTRRYAKRQLTLFRHLPDVRWFIPPDISGISSYIKENA